MIYIKLLNYLLPSKPLMEQEINLYEPGLLYPEIFLTMASKLTDEQIEARINMYIEAADHLTACVHEGEVEEQQSVIVREQILALMKKFSDKYEK